MPGACREDSDAERPASLRVAIASAARSDLGGTRQAAGGELNGARKANTPTLHDVMKSASRGLQPRGVLPTTSGAGWASKIDGVGRE
jgi:hypothetical protein